MRLNGVHHITAITADAQSNVDFYVGVLGLRLVKKTVNQDDPTVYHLFYADEKGDPGSDLTFFEYPGAPLIPSEHALQGFDGVRAYSGNPEASRSLFEEALGFEPREDGWEARGESRGGLYAYDPPPAPPERGLQAAGTVHHIAWASKIEEHEAWREKVIAGGAHPTPVIDRFYFRSIYFREPSGVLFEIATLGPGFTVDEPLERLGEKLSLPPDYEHLRDQVEPNLKPISNPRVPA